MAEDSNIGPTPNILIIDDEVEHLRSLKLIFEREGNIVHTAPSGELALEIIKKEHLAAILSDVQMPGMSGIELLKITKKIQPQTAVIVMTAYGTIELAVEAMREGAYDFVQKPFKSASIKTVIGRALERFRLATENKTLRKKLEAVTSQQSKPIIGGSPAMLETLETIRQAAPSTATVLLLGESGTGKEMMARALHEQSNRSDKPMVVVNCAALPESILEAELFGYEKGAFTGASDTKEGRIERAHLGTLFLDEVGELSLSVQAKLLRVLQEGEFERLGATKPRQVDFRLVSATNRNLEQLISQGQFREDLYYRLNVIGINLPALRERPEDIPLLASHFVQRFVVKNVKAIQGIEKTAMDALRSWNWPGNVRELENIIERAVVLSRSNMIGLEDLPAPLRNPSPRGDSNNIKQDGKNLIIPIGTSLEDAEKMMIHATLEQTGGDKSMAAQMLGIAARTIYRKLEAERNNKTNQSKK